MKCYCGTDMIMVTSKVRKYPFEYTDGLGREERWHCPKCYLVLLRVVPAEECEEDWTLRDEERLRLLGYIK